MRQGAGGFHDSAEDAKAALDLVLWEMNQETPTFEVESPPQTSRRERFAPNSSSIACRKARRRTRSKKFSTKKIAHTSRARANARPNRRPTPSKPPRPGWWEFVDAARADAAFARLNAPIVPDAIGRDQKFQSLPSMTRASGDAVTVTVRRMSTPDASVVTTKRSAARAPPEPPAKKKRQRKPKAIPLPGDK